MATMCEGRSSGFESRKEQLAMDNGDGQWRWTMAVWIQENTERDYSQKERSGGWQRGRWCKSSAMPIQGDDVQRMDLREGRKEQLAMDDGGVDSRGHRARLQSERIWEERSNFWCLATEAMLKILQRCSSRRRCAREGRVDLRERRKEQLAMDDGDGRWRCGFRRIQSETTVRQNMGRKLWSTENGENPCAMLIQGNNV
jgi:hypothetical protein